MADAALAKKKIANYYNQIKKRDYFQIFNVDRDTDLERIKVAYHDLAKQWHADAYAAINIGKSKETLDEIFKTITTAFETLSDPKLRSEYLVLLDRKSKGMSTDVESILRAEQVLDEAIALLRRKQWADAEELLKEGIELNPDDPLYVVHLAWCRYNRDRKNSKVLAESVAMLVEATKRQANLVLAYQYLGQMHFATEKYDQARKWWKKCLEYDRKNIDASRGLRILNQRAEKEKGSGLSAFFNKLFKKK